jgi:hypothetical protein
MLLSAVSCEPRVVRGAVRPASCMAFLYERRKLGSPSSLERNVCQILHTRQTTPAVSAVAGEPPSAPTQVVSAVAGEPPPAIVLRASPLLWLLLRSFALSYPRTASHKTSTSPPVRLTRSSLRRDQLQDVRRIAACSPIRFRGGRRCCCFVDVAVSSSRVPPCCYLWA